MKPILLLHDESGSPKPRLQNVAGSKGTPGCNCDRWGHPLRTVSNTMQEGHPLEKTKPQWGTGSERESAICKRGQHLVAPRNEIGNVVKEQLVILFRPVVLFARNVGHNRGSDNEGGRRPKWEWPHVMNSSVPTHGPLVSGTWIWHHQHTRWHHGYYRTRR